MPSPARVPVPETTPAAAVPPPPRSATPAFRRWAIAVTVYIAAVFNRTSLGVAGLQAARRLGISPAQLSVFVLVQLGVYAAMQVPTGLLVDRYGPRRLLVAAAATMAVAQLAFALTRSYPEALLARGLLGCGDALTFVSVVRIAAQDFPRHRFPLAVSVTSMLGMAGNLAATIPLALLLRSAGWTVSFAGTGLVTLVTGVAVLILLPAGRAAAAPRQPAPAGRTLHRVRAAWRTPGTRLGFWVHFSCMSLATMFAVLWGLPYLVRQGFTEAGASAVLLVCVLAAIVASPAIGAIFGRYPAARVPFALSVCLLTVAGWAAAARRLRRPAAAAADRRGRGAGRGGRARVHHRLLAGPGLQPAGHGGHRHRGGERRRIHLDDYRVAAGRRGARTDRPGQRRWLPAGLLRRGRGAGARHRDGGAVVAAGARAAARRAVTR